MRRLLYLTVLSMLVVALTASVAIGQSRGPSGADGSYNCEDFDTQEQAQAFFDADPSDPDGLDGPPGDAFTGEPGVACESLPSGGDGDTTTTPPAGNGDMTGEGTQQQISCDQFISAAGNPSQFQAQQFYDFQATAAQQAALDADGDGFACDSLGTGVDNLGETDADREAAQQPNPVEQPTEEPAVETGDDVTSLPDTGGPALLLPAAGLALMGLGALGFGVSRQRRS